MSYSLHTAANYFPYFMGVKAQAALNKISFTDMERTLPPRSVHPLSEEQRRKGAVDVTSGTPLIDYSITPAFTNANKSKAFCYTALPLMPSYPFDTQIVTNLSNLEASVIQAGTPFAISKGALNQGKLVQEKCQAAGVVSKELVESGGSQLMNTLQGLTANAIGVTLDKTILGRIDGHSGTTAITSSGTTEANFLSDLRDLLDIVNTTNAGPLIS